MATTEREIRRAGIGERGIFDESGGDCRGAVERESERVFGSLSREVSATGIPGSVFCTDRFRVFEGSGRGGETNRGGFIEGKPACGRRVEPAGVVHDDVGSGREEGIPFACRD